MRDLECIMRDLDYIRTRIFQLNLGDNRFEKNFHKNKDVHELANVLNDNESLDFLVDTFSDGSEGILAVTNTRLIFLHKHMFSGLQFEEIFLDRILDVNFKKGITLSSLMINDGRDFVTEYFNILHSEIFRLVNVINNNIEAHKHSLFNNTNSNVGSTQNYSYNPVNNHSGYNNHSNYDNMNSPSPTTGYNNSYSNDSDHNMYANNASSHNNTFEANTSMYNNSSSQNHNVNHHASSNTNATNNNQHEAHHNISSKKIAKNNELIAQLEAIALLKEKGILTHEEFLNVKARLLS